LQTLALVAQKGGTGKTTLAVSLAVAAANTGRSTLIVDLDPQASACKWADRREGDNPAVLDAQPARLANTLAKAREQSVELSIIDTPARIEQAALEAARNADLVIIPVKPSIWDIETLQATLDLVQGRAIHPPLVVLNAVPAQGGRGDQALKLIRSMGLDVAGTSLGNRVAFEYAAQLGQSAAEYDPQGRAGAEIRQLYEEIMRHIAKLTRKRISKRT
jgi:chromosome partitioning protein